MDNNSFQTSFIPKKPIIGTQASAPQRRPVGVLSFLSVVVCVGILGAYVGLYLYKNTLLNKLSNLHESLKASSESFEPDTVNDLQLFDKRMNVSKQVLSNHIIFSPFFDLLGELTIPSIQFTKFEQTSSPDGKSFSVKMSGIARDYKSIALQAQEFNSDRGKYFKDVIFSNLDLADEKNKKGYVKFNVSFSVDPVLLSYEKQILQFGKDARSVVRPTEEPVGDTTTTVEQTIEPTSSDIIIPPQEDMSSKSTGNIKQ